MASSWTVTSLGPLFLGAASATAGAATSPTDVATARAAARERRVLRKGVLQRTCGNRPPRRAAYSEKIVSRAQLLTHGNRLVTDANSSGRRWKDLVTNRFATFTRSPHGGLSEHPVT